MLLLSRFPMEWAEEEAYNDLSRNACVDCHPDTQPPEQQLALSARLQSCVGMLQEFREPRGLQQGQLHMKGPAYCI